jgi:hypothetical protein
MTDYYFFHCFVSINNWYDVSSLWYCTPRLWLKFTLVKGIIKISSVCRAATLFIPGLGTCPDKFNFLIASLQFYGGVDIHGINACEVVPPAHHGVNPAYRAEAIGVSIFIPHDASGYGGDTILLQKRSVALYTLHDHMRRLCRTG